MKSSEFIMAKALEYDDFRLTKIAQELYDTDKDIEYTLTKEAGPLMSGLLSASKTLLKNNSVKNALIGAGVGAGVGAVTAQPGQGLSGALKGAGLGGMTAGLATSGRSIFKAMKPGIGPGQTFMQAAKQEGSSIMNTGKTFINKVKPLFKQPQTIEG